MKIRNHSCTDRVRKEIMSEDKTIKWLRFDLDTITEFEDNKRVAENKTGQRIVYCTERLNKKGLLIKKEQKSFISHTHCPFCGKKY